jgi:hypothetical protein
MHESVSNFLKHFKPETLENYTLQEHMNFLRRREIYEAFRRLSFQTLSNEDINTQ